MTNMALSIRKKYKILIVILMPSDSKLTKQLQSNNIDIYCLNFVSFKLFVVGLFKLVSLIRSNKPDIVHTFLGVSCLLGGIFSKVFSKSQIIWSIFYTNLDIKENKISTYIVIRFYILFSYLVPNCTIFDSTNSYDKHIKKSFNPNVSKVINNGVNTQEYKASKETRITMRKRLGIDDHFVIGTFARYHPDKGYSLLLKVAKDLIKFDNILFLVSGKGVESSKFSKEIKQQKITNIKIIKNDDIKILELLNSIDLYLSPSISESFSLIICEAMSCGVPCLVTNVGDSAKIVGGNDMVVESNNSTDMSTQIRLYLDKPKNVKKAISIRSRKRIVKYFNLEEMVGEYEDLYNGNNQ
jgi:glycosyltransferase involved in cell wall biosynthesis